MSRTPTAQPTEWRWMGIVSLPFKTRLWMTNYSEISTKCTMFSFYFKENCSTVLIFFSCFSCSSTKMNRQWACPMSQGRWVKKNNPLVSSSDIPHTAWHFHLLIYVHRNMLYFWIWNKSNSLYCPCELSATKSLHITVDAIRSRTSNCKSKNADLNLSCKR